MYNKIAKHIIFVLYLVLDLLLFYSAFGYLLLGIKSPKIFGEINATFMGMYFMSITYFSIFVFVNLIFISGMILYKKRWKNKKPYQILLINI